MNQKYLGSLFGIFQFIIVNSQVGGTFKPHLVKRKDIFTLKETGKPGFAVWEHVKVPFFCLQFIQPCVQKMKLSEGLVCETPYIIE